MIIDTGTVAMTFLNLYSSQKKAAKQEIVVIDRSEYERLKAISDDADKHIAEEVQKAKDAEKPFRDYEKRIRDMEYKQSVEKIERLQASCADLSLKLEKLEKRGLFARIFNMGV